MSTYRNNQNDCHESEDLHLNLKLSDSCLYFDFMLLTWNYLESSPIPKIKKLYYKKVRSNFSTFQQEGATTTDQQAENRLSSFGLS